MFAQPGGFRRAHVLDGNRNNELDTAYVRMSLVRQMQKMGSRSSQLSHMTRGMSRLDFGEPDMPPPERPLTRAEAVLHIVKGNVGPGCLVLPYFFVQVGPLVGLVVLILVSLQAAYGMRLLVIVKSSLQSRMQPPPSRPLSFDIVGQMVLGGVGMLAVRGCIMALQVGSPRLCGQPYGQLYSQPGHCTRVLHAHPIAISTTGWLRTALNTRACARMPRSAHAWRTNAWSTTTTNPLLRLAAVWSMRGLHLLAGCQLENRALTLWPHGYRLACHYAVRGALTVAPDP